MEILPGSERMVGGPHVCHIVEIDPLFVDDKYHDRVYAHVAYLKNNEINDNDRIAVIDTVNEMRSCSYIDVRSTYKSLPGVFTHKCRDRRVDLRVYTNYVDHNTSMWAEVYRL